jgi:hypothetical protein
MEEQHIGLLLPADGSETRLMTYRLMKRDSDGELNLDAEYFDPIPDLRPWFDTASRERAFATFEISGDTACKGKYCLYYTTSLTPLPNETCKRAIGIDAPPDRLFWRGDVIVVRYEGELGMNHRYVDTTYSILGEVTTVLQKAYCIRGLESVAEGNTAFQLEMAKSSQSSFDLTPYTC